MAKITLHLPTRSRNTKEIYVYYSYTIMVV